MHSTNRYLTFAPPQYSGIVPWSLPRFCETWCAKALRHAHVMASMDHHSAHTAFLEHGAAGSTATVDHSAHGERQVFTKAIPTGHPEGEAREGMEEAEWEPEMGVGLRLLRAVR